MIGRIIWDIIWLPNIGCVQEHRKQKVEKMKNQISETIHMLDKDKITDKRLRWEFLKYKIRKFTINLSKKFVKEENKDRHFLEKELKKLEKKPK